MAAIFVAITGAPHIHKNLHRGLLKGEHAPGVVHQHRPDLLLGKATLPHPWHDVVQNVVVRLAAVSGVAGLKADVVADDDPVLVALFEEVFQACRR